MDKFFAPTGRIQKYLDNPDAQVTPASCTIADFPYDLNFDSFNNFCQYLAYSLKYGAGINVHLNGFKAENMVSYGAALKSKKVAFMLNKNHPDYSDFFYNEDRVLSDNETVLSCPKDSLDSIVEAVAYLFVKLPAIESDTIYINLSNLREAGNTNSVGMVASGPRSFANLFKAALWFAKRPDITGAMHFISVFNQEIRRGGQFKNGAVTTSLRWDHPNINEYLESSPIFYPYLKKGITVTNDSPDEKLLQLIIKKVNEGTLWVEKLISSNQQFLPKSLVSLDQPSGDNVLQHNVCLRGSELVWVDRGNGAIVQTIASLSGKTVKLFDVQQWVESEVKLYGKANIFFRITLSDGRSFYTTSDHRNVLENGDFKKSEDLEVGDTLKVHDISCKVNKTPLYGCLETDERKLNALAYLKGFFTGDGTSHANKPILRVHGDKIKCIMYVQKLLSIGYSELQQNENYNYPIYQVNGISQLSSLVPYCKDFRRTFDTELLTGDVNDLVAYISGAFDADGTFQPNRSGKSGSYSITSIYVDWLQGLQTGLRKLGVESRLCAHSEGGVKDFKDRGGLCTVQPSYRLVLSYSNSYKLSQICTFARLAKPANPGNTPRPKNIPSEIVAIDVVNTEPEKVYCAVVPTTNQFALGNGILTGNCREVLIKPGETCTISPINLGQITDLDQIPDAMVYGIEQLIKVHQLNAPYRVSKGLYKSKDEDSQIGLGFIGLANLLAYFGITYKQLADIYRSAYEGEFKTKLDPNAMKFCKRLNKGFQDAAKIAKHWGYKRAFAIAPTASTAFRNVDSQGYTTVPNIQPAKAPTVERVSDAVKDKTIYVYPPNVELMKDVSYDDYYGVACLFQAMMNETGLAHAISFDIIEDWDVKRFNEWFNGPLTSTYYRQLTDYKHLDKSDQFCSACAG
jgi:ribonucleotide reductase alpha subunit